jgi:hypothetical protein
LLIKTISLDFSMEHEHINDNFETFKGVYINVELQKLAEAVEGQLKKTFDAIK